MTKIAHLINEFRSEATNKLANIDTSRKPEIVSELEEFADDQRVSDFFFSIVVDESEYDLARIEVLKILEVKDFADLEVSKKAVIAICHVLTNSREENVRNFAAMAAVGFMENERIFGVIERILLDPQEPSDLRWNAFAAIESHKVSQRSIGILNKLYTDKEFNKSAKRVLSEWCGDGK